jgi:molybdenum cofactor cytidylyltransferase
VTVAAVVLAAGLGSRFAGPTHKLTALVDGRPVVVHAVANAVAAGLDEVIVVVGATPLPDLADLADGRTGRTGAVGGIGTAGGTGTVRIVENPDAAAGQATSVRAALAAAAAAGHDAVVIGLGDQPFIPAAAWRAVADARDATGTPARIAVATYGGRRANPVRLAATVWPEVPAAGDSGARLLFASHPDLVVEVPCPGDPRDIDTVEDLAAARAARAHRPEQEDR